MRTANPLLAHPLLADSAVAASPPIHPQVIQLRDLLRKKYPEAHRGPPSRSVPTATSIAAATGATLPEALGFPDLAGQFTEILGGAAGEDCPGMGLALHHLLAQASAAGRGVALVDGTDRFDPQSYPSSLCRNLFWARCRAGERPRIDTALKVTDLFLRDGNLPLIILDLFQHPEPEFARVHLSVWYRLRQLTEQSGCALCLLAARSTGAAAHRRLLLTSSFSLDSLDLPRSTLLSQVRLRRERAQPYRQTPAQDLDPSFPPTSRRIA